MRSLPQSFTHLGNYRSWELFSTRVHIFPNVNVRGLYSDQSSGMRNGLSSSRRYRCAYQNGKLLVEEALSFEPRFSEGALDFRLDDVRVLGMGGSNVKVTLVCLHSWHGALLFVI
jgi:hypothetical protein